MDLIKYFEEKRRMLDSLGRTGGGCNGIICTNCTLGNKNNKRGINCFELEVCHPEEAVAIVEKWSQEHPRKTMLQDFLEKFPKAPLKNGIPRFTCPRHLGYTDTEDSCGGKCVDCWNRPLVEGEK